MKRGNRFIQNLKDAISTGIKTSNYEKQIPELSMTSFATALIWSSQLDYSFKRSYGKPELSRTILVNCSLQLDTYKAWRLHWLHRENEPAESRHRKAPACFEATRGLYFQQLLPSSHGPAHQGTSHGMLQWGNPPAGAPSPQCSPQGWSPFRRTAKTAGKQHHMMQ